MKPGDIIETLNNKKMTIESVLSKERTLFEVIDNGKRKILELYDTSFSFDGGESAFRIFIDGSPDTAFVWPETRLKDNVYGYVYGSRNSDYISMSSLLGDVELLKDFNLNSIINACIRIIDAYKNAYRNSLTCMNIEDHDIFINPKTGDVLIYGFEKMAIPANRIYVKPDFEAPESIENGSRFNDFSNEKRYAELFGIGVILFELCFWCHPFRGKKEFDNPCFTEETIKDIYGKKAVFIFDPIDESNRIVLNNYSAKRWNCSPKYVRDFFLHAFSKETIQTPEYRKSFIDWQALFVRIHNDIIRCKSCGSLIVFDNMSCVCPCCNQSTGVEYVIETGKYNYIFPAAKGKRVISYWDLSLSVYGEVVSAKNNPNTLGIKNLTNSNWIASINGNSIRQFSSGEIVPIKEGVEIRTGRGWIKVKKLNREYKEDDYSERKALDVELATYQMLPLICVVDTSDEMSIIGNDRLRDMLVESIKTLNEAAESNNYILGTSILFYADEVQWMPFNCFSMMDSLQVNNVDFKGRPNLGKALESMNEMMTRENLFAERDENSYKCPIVLFYSSGVSEDDFEEEIERLKDNDWFRSSTRIALIADKSFDVNIPKALTGDVDAILSVKDIDLLKKFVRMPLD